MSATRLKAVFVGEFGVGKRSLVLRYSRESFPDETLYLQKFSENYTADIAVDDKEVELTLCQTASSDDYARLRPLMYADTDVFLLCFAINDRESLQRTKDKWKPELEEFSPRVPILLIGLKQDKRLNDVAKDCISFAEGENMSKNIKASSYIECSAKNAENVDLVFETAARVAMAAKKTTCRCKRRYYCEIL